MRARLAWLAAAAALALGAPGVGAASRDKAADHIWRHPDFARLAPGSIAMMPPSSFSNSFEAEKLADGVWGQGLRGTGYRWMSATSSRALLGAGAGGDSLLKAARESSVRHGRLDSLLARAVCRRLRVGAALTLHVDRWEQMKIEFNQSGKPTTTVALVAGLVDSTGRLLWSASGSETAEGPYHDPSAGVLGVKSSGLDTQPMTNQGGPPSYVEVLTSLVGRWATQFPRAAAPVGAVGAAAGAPADTARR